MLAQGAGDAILAATYAFRGGHDCGPADIDLVAVPDHGRGLEAGGAVLLRGRSQAVMRRGMSPTVTDQGAARGLGEEAGKELVAKFFRALGDPTRLNLLAFLMEVGEATGSECVERAGLSQGRVSAHLGCLVSCGLVSVRREGRFAYYRVVDRRVRQLVALGRGMTADHAASIAACLKVGPPTR
jgi:DNA-binding transcriptional ArsR family regulator